MIAKRAMDMSSFIVMDILEQAHKLEKQGIEIIHLEVGEPDFDTPECVKETLIEALHDGFVHYTHSLGLLSLREEICCHYKTKYEVTIQPDQIIVTSGTSPAMLILFAALLEEKDNVIIADPHYACYPNFIQFVNAQCLFVKTHEEDGFQYRPEEIKKVLTKNSQAIIINSPANPTGVLMSQDRMQAIAELSPYIVSDEIYHGLVYQGKEHSILEFTDRAFVLNGFSKLYAMTGLRLGYCIAPQEFIRPMQKIQQNFFISASSVVQKAGISALKHAGEDITRMKKTYNSRRKYLIERLRALGFQIKVEPTGAFYVFVNVKHLATDSYKLAFDILEKAHVGVTPGIDFGANGEGYIRFSYANSMENIKKGMDRLENYFHNFRTL